MTPDEGAVDFAQTLRESELSQRIRPLAVVVIRENPIVLANEYDHFSFSRRPLVDGVNVRQVGRQLAPETVDFHWIVWLETALSYPPKVLSKYGLNETE